MTVLTLAGKLIDWHNPPKPTDRVIWSERTTGGKQVTGSLRTIAHLDRLNNLSLKMFKSPVKVLQGPYNTTVKASAGTHDYDACLDVYIPGVAWLTQQTFFRANGAGAYWRRPPAFGNHIHYFTLPPREGKDVNDDFKVAGFKVGLYVDGGWSTRGHKVASSQISDYYQHRTALSGHAKDPTWFPPDIPATIFDLDAYIARRQGKKPKPKPKPTPTPTPAPNDPSLRVDGVDISHWQAGKLDFVAAAKAGVKWVCHKATEGVTYKDPYYARRRSECKASGMPFGAYHFARPGRAKGDATAEAEWFLKVAQPKPGDMIPMLDIEVTDGLTMTEVRLWVIEFSSRIVKALGVKPLVYTNNSWDLGETVEKPHVIWRARYNNDNREPVRAWDIFQFSNGQLGRPNSVAGLGHVDLNHMRKGLTLKQLRIPAEDAEPEPKPKPEPKPEPKPPAKNKPTATFRAAFAPLQFSDNAGQKAHDARAIFSQGYDFLAGTEAGPGSGNLPSELRKYAAMFGYAIHLTDRYDTWVAAKKTLIHSNLKTGAVHAVDRATKHDPEPPGRWGDRGVVWMSFNMGPTFGTVVLGSVHFLTTSGAGAKLKRETDAAYSQVIKKWGETHGAGRQVALLGGDFNKPLKNQADPFGGVAPFETCWSDLRVYPPTGPKGGTIDAWCRYLPDTRVKFTGARSRGDGEFFLHTDHLLVEAEVQFRAI